MAERPTVWKEFDKAFEEIKAGKAPVPNLEEIPAEDFLSHIVGWRGAGGQGGHAKIQGSNVTATATFFPNATQGGRFDGSGHVIWSGGWSTDQKRYVTKTARFAICIHKKTEEGHSPNHQRGWHPGHCELCGLDMSVDSGD